VTTVMTDKYIYFGVSEKLCTFKAQSTPNVLSMQLVVFVNVRSRPLPISIDQILLCSTARMCVNKALAAPQINICFPGM
jgi:hypothetical protein